MQNITIFDNGVAFMVEVDKLIVSHHSTLGDAWKHIQWMYRIAGQNFTVGEKKISVIDWIAGMTKAGYLD